MRIKYVAGPPVVTLGKAGRWKLGQERDIDDGLAKGLLAKKSVRFERVQKKQRAMSAEQ